MSGESEWDKRRYIPKPGEPELPPQLTEYAEKTTEQVMEDLNRLPFFMTKLDNTDGEGGENVNLEALKSLAYDGEPHEIAENFKNQGNDHYKAKNYKTAIEFYSKGLDVEFDDETIKKALYLNRAACNLELKNFRQCIEDCKKALIIDEKNVKACYRSGRAFFAIERYDEAKQILEYGISVDETNESMKQLLQKIVEKEEKKAAAEKKRVEQENMKKLQKTMLDNVYKLRNFSTIKSERPIEFLQEAPMHLEDPTDPESQMIFPLLILYPVSEEMDFIGEVSELTTPQVVIDIIMDREPAWFADPKHKYFSAKNMQAYMETESGGLVKVGRNTAFNKPLSQESPKVPLLDNAIRLYLVPKQESAAWISTWNKEAVLAKRLMKIM